MDGIKTIIIDLGGVIVDLDTRKTIQSFSLLSGKSQDDVRRIYQSHPSMTDFEIGRTTADVFRKEIRRVLELNEVVTDRDIDDAWNAMLLGVPKQKLDLLASMKGKYTVFILSNTNSIHIDHIDNIMLPRVAEVRSFEPFAHKVYYSYHMRMRKPDDEIYQYVLRENNLNGEETLFLDDNPDNIRGAERVGIRARQVAHPDQVYEILGE